MRKAFGKNFSEGGRPRWTPLSQRTIRGQKSGRASAPYGEGNIQWRLKQRGNYGPENVLIEGGALRDSYRRKGARGHVERLDSADGNYRGRE